MARSIGGGIAEGLESGFQIGRQIDADKLARRAADRADDEFNLRAAKDKREEARKGLNDNLDLLDRQQKLVTNRQGEIERLSTAAQTAGQPVDPGLAKEYGANAEQLTGIRQRAMDFFSRAQTGQINPIEAPNAELYSNLVAATGMSLPELRQVPKSIADVQAGLETNNQGLLVQGVNGVLGPQLRRGVGQPSPYGGTITRKEVIGLDPAVDNNHQPLPGKFMPRLRVYVSGMQDGDSDGGGERYYDAPMTVDGSGEGDDRVSVIDVAHGMQWMGNLGTLATAIQNPEIAAKLDKGEKEAGPKMKQYLDQLTAISRPAKTKGVAGDKLEVISQYAKRKGISEDAAAKQLQGMGVIPNLGALSQKLAAIDDLDVPEEQKEVLKRDAALGAGGKTTGLIPQKPVKGVTGEGSAMSSKYGKDKDYTKQVDYWAEFVGKGGTLPSRFSQIVGKDMSADVFKAVAGQGTPTEQIANKAEVGGLNAGARAVGTRAANFGLAKSEAYEMADLVTEASSKVSRTSFMPINKALIALKENTGDVEVRQYGAAINSFINAYARAVSPIGTPTVSDKDHARDMLSKADSHSQVVGIIDQLKKEMVAAGNAPKVVRAEQREAALGIGGGGVKPGASKYAEGQTATGPGGKKMIFKGGAWQPM